MVPRHGQDRGRLSRADQLLVNSEHKARKEGARGVGMRVRKNPGGGGGGGRTHTIVRKGLVEQ